MKDKWKVLLIDDESEFHQLLRAAFPELDLFSAYSIEGGSWLIARTMVPFDLILLDLNLHEDSQAFEKLKQISRITFSPVIVLSTYADHNARFEVQKRGASDFLSKGNFDLNAWLGIIKKVLAKAVSGQSRVFLSFAKEDRAFGYYLSDRLMENQVNIVLQNSFFNNGPLPNFLTHYGKADFVVLTLSPEAIASGRVQSHINEAVQLEEENKILCIIPILLKPCELPEKLRNKQSINFIEKSTFPEGFKALVEMLKK